MALVRIDPEFEKLIAPLAAEELALLEKSILENGCFDSLKMWNGVLLDGHNRYRICIKHNRPLSYSPVRGIETREEAILWIERNQLGRRNITDAYRKYLIGDIEDRRGKMLRAAQLAEARDKKSAGISVQDENVLHSKGKKKQTRSDVAQEHGISEHALKQVKKIRDAAETNPKAQEVVEKIRDGKIKSLAEAVRQVEPDSSNRRLIYGLHHDPKGPLSINNREAAVRMCADARLMATKGTFLLGDPEKVLRYAEACKDRDPLDLLLRDLQEIQRVIDTSLPVVEAVLAKWTAIGERVRTEEAASISAEQAAEQLTVN